MQRSESPNVRSLVVCAAPPPYIHPTTTPAHAYSRRARPRAKGAPEKRQNLSPCMCLGFCCFRLDIPTPSPRPSVQNHGPSRALQAVRARPDAERGLPSSSVRHVGRCILGGRAPGDDTRGEGREYIRIYRGDLRVLLGLTGLSP